MKGFTDRYESQLAWSEEDIDYAEKIERIINIDPIVEKLQSRCICDCEMFDKSDVKLAFVRWFKERVEHMESDISNAFNNLDDKAFRENLPQI